MRAALKQLTASWYRFWYQPEPIQALGCYRILFYAGLLVAFGGIDFSPLSQVAKAFWVPTSFYAEFFHRRPVSPEMTIWLQLIWKMSLVTSAAGFLTRFSTTVSGALGLYLIGLPYNFGKVDHDMAITGMILLMLPFSECGRIWSIDQLLARHRGKSLLPLSGEEARWPIQFTRVAIALLFFCAGLNKLRHAGIPWVTSNTFQTYLLLKAAPLGLWMAQYPRVCHVLAGFTIVTEFFYPLAFFSKKLAPLWVIAGLAMFAGIDLLLNVSFFFLMFLHFVWLPWRRLFSAFSAMTNKTSHRVSALPGAW